MGRYQLALEKEVFVLSLLLKTKAQSLRGRGGEVVVDFALLNTQMWLAAPTVFRTPASVVATMEGHA